MSYKPSGESVWPDEPFRLRCEASRTFLAENDLIGLTVEEARRRVEEAGLPFRHVELDSPIPHALSADLRAGRITATAKGGVVIKAEAFN